MPEFAVSSYYENEFEKDPEAVFIDVHSEEQEVTYGCGPAVLTDILKTLNYSVTQNEILEEARKGVEIIPGKDPALTIEKIGTPTQVMKDILERHGVSIDVKESVSEINEETKEEAEKYLDKTLESGKVIICPVQTIPDYGYQRNINEDGHYVIVCGKVTISGRKYYITVDPMFHRYQRASNEGSVYSFHMGDSLREGMPKSTPYRRTDTVDTRNLRYTDEELKSFVIDPSKYGLRFVVASHFIEYWKDVSGFGDFYNFYGITVKIKKD
ncbi:MAG: hypothetical protein KatS3mg101_0635 [Patescibacteria group bacterium]|nr:MAG: hypothetical protein KatS3mg101_0635 [Patescibacteria group bacterium]